MPLWLGSVSFTALPAALFPSVAAALFPSVAAAELFNQLADGQTGKGLGDHVPVYPTAKGFSRSALHNYLYLLLFKYGANVYFVLEYI